MPKGFPPGLSKKIYEGMREKKEKPDRPSFDPKKRPPVVGRGRPDFAGVPGVGRKGRRGKGVGSFRGSNASFLENDLDDKKKKPLYRGRPNASVPTSRKEANFLARYKNNGNEA